MSTNKTVPESIQAAAIGNSDIEKKALTVRVPVTLMNDIDEFVKEDGVTTRHAMLLKMLAQYTIDRKYKKGE